MKISLFLSVIIALSIACGQSTTPEPTSGPTETRPVIQPSATTVIDEIPTKSPTVSQAGDERENSAPAITPSGGQEDPPKSTHDQSDEQIAVAIYLTGDGQEEKISAFIKSNGGDPRNVSAGYIEAYIPMSLLAELSERSEVGRVQKIIPPEPN